MKIELLLGMNSEKTKVEMVLDRDRVDEHVFYLAAGGFSVRVASGFDCISVGIVC